MELFLFATHYTADGGTGYDADNGCYPEEPQLDNSLITNKHSYPGTARRIRRGICY